VITALISCCAILLVVALIGRAVHHGRVITRRVNTLYQAAASGDRAQLQDWLDRGHSIDLQDREGNTALHFAYYQGEQHAIDALVAYGADDNLRNKEGLSPSEMRVLAEVENQLDLCVDYLNDAGNWLDRDRGWTIYSRIKEYQARIYNPALVRCVLRSKQRRKLLRLAIKLGVRGSEERLAQVLRGYGTKEMATDYLNAGSDVLSAAAQRWARQHNYRIIRMGRGAAATWGRF
jgi:hypothetical protein